MKTQKFLLAVLLTLSTVATVYSQTAEEIIAKHIEAIGGKDAWKKLNSLKKSGTMTANGTEIAVSMSAVEKKGTRQDIIMGGMSGYQILTTTEGWSYMPFGGQQKPEAMTADEVKESQDQLDIQGALIDYKEKGHTLEYLGKEDVEGTECFKLKLSLKSGTVKTIFIDPTSYYEIREVKKAMIDGKEVEQAVNYSNFQKLPEGIVVPMTVGIGFGDVNFKKFEVNPKIDDSIFKVG